MSFWKKHPPRAPPVIRIERVQSKINTAPPSISSSTTKTAIARPAAQSRLAAGRSTSNLTARGNATSSKESDATKSSPTKKSRKRSPAYRPVESDSSDNDTVVTTASAKRLRLSSNEVEDPDRRLRARKPLSEADSKAVIHAADIASLKLGFKPCFGQDKGGDAKGKDVDVGISLHYPGSSLKEWFVCLGFSSVLLDTDIISRYDLVYRNDCFDPVEEIIGIAKEVGSYFVEEPMADKFLNPETGIIRKMERARNLKSLDGFKTALLDYNKTVDGLRNDGSFKKVLDAKHSLPESLVIRIMTQSYDRVVSPKVDLLRKYENGTNEVYGELKSNLVYKILAETGLTSNQVFVDLGSGVANVVLQAALQVGCESWGCEIMDNACALADAQKVEFEARCRLWGIQPGKSRLEHGDFMANHEIRGALQRADVVLVNNEVFRPELNVSLVNLFLDLKEGCKVVSLKSFVAPNRKITQYNSNDPSNVLEVEKRTYSTKSVSWKDEGGDYYVATKNSKRLLQAGSSE